MVAPKENVDVPELLPEPKTNGLEDVGAEEVSAGAGWLSCCCPKIKVLVEGASEVVFWPKIKAPFWFCGAGVTSRLELLVVPKRLGTALEDVAVIDELVMKPNTGFGTEASAQNKNIQNDRHCLGT